MIIQILFSIPLLTLAYNVDIDHPVLYSDPDENSYFGYSVLLHYDRAANESWLIVGAPRGNQSTTRESNSTYPHEPGIVYRCDVEGTCTNVTSERIENEDGFIAQLGMKTTIQKDDGWFGAAISVERKTGLLTVCAPRTIMRIFNPYEKQYTDTMQGMCYNGVINSGTVSIENKDVAGYNFREQFWYNPLHGFSVHYPSPRDNKYAMNRIIGEPRHDLYGRVDIKYMNSKKSIDLPIDDELAQFGYSVTSGHYFGESQLLFAAGAPGWQYVGQVGIIAPLANKPIVGKLQGNDVGEFFGASLATGDLNNDGFDDLLVGAPHWGQDNGRVYVYLGSSVGKLDAGVVIEGAGEGDQFGYSLVCGDLDDDGYSDIIVGAPWEDSGVIYIYNGDADIRDKDRLVASQRIPATSLYDPSTYKGLPIERFGFSIAEPIDIDENGYPDVAVGAYMSGHVALMRSKPVLETTLNVSATPKVLQQGTRNFMLTVCVTYYVNTQTVKITIDEKFRRTDTTSMNVFFHGTSEITCSNNNVTIKDDIQNLIDPITVIAEHAFVKDTSAFCSSCAIEYKGRKSKVAQILIQFENGCGVDDVCNSNISVVSRFYGTQDNDTWLIGSNDISIEATLTNHGEPAHLLSITFVLPHGVKLQSILPSCQEDTLDNKVTVECDLGNALEKETPKSVKLDLDMKHMLDGMLHDHVLEFPMLIDTRSKNDGTKETTRNLTLKSQASLTLNGKAHEENYYLPPFEEETPNVRFQQTYQIVKQGFTPIIQAQLVLKVPLARKDHDPFLQIYKPMLYISGRLFECTSEDASFLETHGAKTHNDVATDQFNLFSKAGSNESLTSYAQITQLTRYVPTDVTRDFRRDTVYLNCSRNDMKCALVHCDISELKTQDDIGKLIMNLVFNASKLQDSFPRVRQIKTVMFSTEARVRIIEPRLRLDVPGSRSVMQLTTSFNFSPKTQKLQMWVYILSVSLGLVLLCVIIIILSTLGFFNRKKNRDSTALNTDDGDSQLQEDSQTGTYEENTTASA